MTLTTTFPVTWFAVDLALVAHGGGGNRAGFGWEFLFPILFFGGFAAIAILVFYLNYLWEKKRTEAMKQVADEMGFDFVGSPDSSMFAEVGGLYLFEQGHSKRFGNLMSGEANGMELRLFDYWYTTGSGKSKSTHVQTVVCFLLYNAGLPPFSMRPQNFFHTIGTWFGYQDINFESHPQFSSYYLLRGNNEEAVRQLFTQQALDHFETIKGTCVEGGGDVLVCYRAAKRTDPKELRTLMEEGFKALAALRPGTGSQTSP